MGGLDVQWLRTGLRFPAGNWAVSQQRKHQILATRTVVSDKGPGPSALQKGISIKTGSSEASHMFIKREKSTARVDRHIGKLR